MKVKYGKLGTELLVISVLSALVLSLVNWLLISITPPTSMGVWYTFLIAVVSVVFFVFAMKINPGREKFLTSIPVVIMALAIVGLLKTWFNIIPALGVEFTWSSLAFGLGSVYFASAITKKYILK